MSGRAILEYARREGYDVFIVPFEVSPPLSGIAWRDDGIGYINIFVDVNTPWGAYVLAHEIAHHEKGHTRGRKPYTPRWVWEFEADLGAFEIMDAHFEYEETYGVRELAREHMRVGIEPILEDMIYQHGEIEIAIWSGLPIPHELAFGEWA